MKYLFSFLLFCGAFSLQAQEPAQWDLKSCVEYAIQHNISVQQADVSARLAKLQAELASSNRLPTINGSTGMGMRFGRSIDPTTNGFSNTQFLYNNFGLNGGVQLYNAGKLKNNAEATSLSWFASEADKLTIANDISLNVATYYLQILSAIEQTEITKIQIQQTKEQLAATAKRVEVGLLPELNLLELETQLANDSSSYITAISNVQQSKLNMMALLNLDAAKPFEIVTQAVDQIKLQTFADLQPDYVFNVASQNMPNVKAATLRVKAAEKNSLAAKASFYPTLSFGYNLTSNFSNQSKNWGTVWNGWNNQVSNNFGQNVGLQMSIPIFNGNQSKINYQQSKLNLSNVILQADNTHLKLKQDIYSAYTNAIVSFNKLNAAQKALNSSEKTYQFATKRYELGLLGTIELLNNQNNYLKAKVNFKTAQYEYVFRIKLLEFYKGEALTL
ncbi:MAG: TolC family protein [Chitinophagia bacterium]|jgi:outer membrane protein